MAFQLYDDSPSLMKPGVYQSGNLTGDQLGLNTIDLEKYSLGNWNSIVRNNRKFWSPLTDPSVSSLIEKGRPVQFRFVPTHIIAYDIAYKSMHMYANFNEIYTYLCEFGSHLCILM